MDINSYSQLIQKLLLEHASYKSPSDQIEIETVFDSDTHRYLLLHVGWKSERRVYGVVLHLEIKEGKIWIQHDGTEDGIAGELMAAGVPQKEIVLGWHYPPMRKHTPFAVN